MAEKSGTLKSAYGSTKAYTRHTAACPHRDERDHNDCRCAKWLYVNPRGGKPRRYTLITHSWPEALDIATDTLKAFDPEIAASRAAQQKAERQQMSVEDACQLWLDKTARDFGIDGAHTIYRSLAKKVIAWATTKQILFIQDITTLELEKWSTSADWLDYADLTRQQRWSALRSMFKYLADAGVLDKNPIRSIEAIKLKGEHAQGPYTNEQVKAMFKHIDAAAENLALERREVYVKRLRAFMNLLLHSGCDLIDGVMFDQSMVEKMRIERSTVSVLKYKRAKTGVEAVIPLTDDVVKTLRSVPTLPENPKGMPFRSDVDIDSDIAAWSRRIARVMKAAKVEYVILPGKDPSGRPRRKKANTKQLRHTAAVNWLIAGQPIEAVARMLGHTDTQMIRKHYAPFVKGLMEAHVRMVVGNWKAGKK